MGIEDKDYYKILGVDRFAAPDDIKKAYHRLAFQYHPDHNPGDATKEEQFKLINEAYENLGDLVRRALYDNRNNRGEPIASTQTVYTPESAYSFLLLQKILAAISYKDIVLSVEELSWLKSGGVLAEAVFEMLKKSIQGRVFSLLWNEIKKWGSTTRVGALENDIEQCCREQKISSQQRDELAMRIARKRGF